MATKKTAGAAAAETTTAVATTPVVPAKEEPVVDALSAKIKEYGGDDAVLEAVKALGVENLDDLGSLNEGELTGAGLKLVKARKLLAELKAAAKPAEAPVAAPSMIATPAPDFGSVLPALPSDESFLKNLKIGGVLKVDDPTYISIIRVYLADRCGLFSIPDTLSEAMEKFADESDEPVDPTFFELKAQITRRDYGDLFAAIPGLNGTFVSKARRAELLRRVRTELCPAFRESNHSLNAWYDSMMASVGNPAAFMSSISALLSGGGAAMTANIPSTDPIRDASDTLKDAINHTFRGTSLPIAAAMAYEAMEIVKVLENRALPAMIGTANRDQMLKKLGVNITPNYARLEQNLARYVLAYIKFSDEAVGNEVAYLTALWQLGKQIPWDELIGDAIGGRGVTGLTGKPVL